MKESIDQMVGRQEDERLELETNPDVTAEGKEYFSQLLQSKHDIETTIGERLPDNLATQRYIETTPKGETPHPAEDGGYRHGDIVTLGVSGGEVDAVFAGVDNDEAVFNVPVEENDGTRGYDTIRIPKNELYDTDTETHEPKTVEPPSQIEAVAQVEEESTERPTLTPEEEKEYAHKLNALKKNIDAQWAIINDKQNSTQAEIRDAFRSRDSLYGEAQAIALSLAGGGLFEMVRPLTGELAKKDVDPKTLSPEKQDAYYDARARKTQFIDTLKKKHVEPAIAGELYHEFTHRAEDLLWLADALEKGDKTVLEKPRARKTLEWHAVPILRKDQITATLAEILPIVENYRRPPEKLERKKNTAVKDAKEEKKKPKTLMDRVRIAIAEGQVIEDRVLQSIVKDSKSEEEKKEAQAILAARKKEQQEHKGKERVPTLRERVRDAIANYKEGDTLPSLQIMKEVGRHEPSVRQFLESHPELFIETPKEEDDYNVENELARMDGEGNMFSVDGEDVDTDEDVFLDDIERWETEGNMQYGPVPKEIKESLSGFDPEREIQEILKAPTSERKKLLAEYKAKLAWQRRGLAEAESICIAEITQSPDITEEDFMALFVATTRSLYSPTEKHNERARELFRKYKEKHDAIEKARADFPDDKELFRAVFGFVPTGKIEIIKGPASFFFRIHDEKEYALIRTGEYLKSEPNVTEELIEKSNISHGSALGRSFLPGTEGSIIIENAHNRPFDELSQETLIHEEQHVANRILMKEVNVSTEPEKIINEAATVALELSMARADEKDPNQKIIIEKKLARLKQLDERFLRHKRKNFVDHRAANEIIAYLKDGTPAEQIFEKLAFPSPGSAYDYSQSLRSENPVSVGYLKAVDDPLMHECAESFKSTREKIILTEYHNALRTGLDSYQRLRDEGYEEGAIRAILLQEPLTRWEKVATRLIREKKFIAIDSEVVGNFNEKFGVTAKELEHIPAFINLSSGQQMLVLQNLEQTTLENVKRDAKKAQETEWGNTKWWKKLLLSAGTMGSYTFARTKKFEKDLLKTARGGNSTDLLRSHAHATHLAQIEALALVAGKGPEVELKNGEIEIHYVKESELFGSGVYAGEIAERNTLTLFNRAATEFARIPREWGYAPKDERDEVQNTAYHEAKMRYENAKRDLLEASVRHYERRGDPTPEKSALLAMNGVDERLQLNQLFNAHPDAEQALAAIEDQNVIAEGLKDFWQDKGKYLALGGALRIASGVATGGLGALVVGATSGLIGGYVGRLQGRAEKKKFIRDRRISRRMSAEDEREEIIVTNQRTGEIILRNDKQPLTRRIKEYSDATFFSDRIERLTTKLEQTTDVHEKHFLEEKIAKTAALMEEKLHNGLINFGGSGIDNRLERLGLKKSSIQATGAKDSIDRYVLEHEVKDIDATITQLKSHKGDVIANRLAFMQALGKANTIEITDKEKLDAEIERITAQHQEKIEKVYREDVVLAGRKAALIKGSYAIAGAYIAGAVKDFIHDTAVFGGGVKEATESVSPKASTGEIPSYPDAEPDTANPEWFNAANHDRNMELVIGRKLSGEEVALLRKTGGIDDVTTADMDARARLIGAMGDTKQPLTHDELSAVMLGRPLPLASRAPGVSVSETLSPGEKVVALHTVSSGENLTRIMKDNLTALKGLSPREQENIIQNLLRSLTKEEMVSLGITDPDHIVVGQKINLAQLETILSEKKIYSENLIAHAQRVADKIPNQEAVQKNIFSPDARNERFEGVEPPQGDGVTQEEMKMTEKIIGKKIKDDVGVLFGKSPFEEWPREWFLLKDRSALEVFAQNEDTNPRIFNPEMREVPKGYDWETVSKIHDYMLKQGLTPEKGIYPLRNETLEQFLLRALKQKK